MSDIQRIPDKLLFLFLVCFGVNNNKLTSFDIGRFDANIRFCHMAVLIFTQTTRLKEGNTSKRHFSHTHFLMPRFKEILDGGVLF